MQNTQSTPRRPHTMRLRNFCMFDVFVVAAVMLSLVFVSSPTYTASARVHAVLRRTQPRGRKLTSPAGQSMAPNLQVIETSVSTALGKATFTSTPVSQMRLAAFSASSGPPGAPTTSPKMCGPKRAFRLVSPSRFAVEMKAWLSPEARSNKRSAAKAQSQETFSRSPASTSLHGTSTNAFDPSYRQVFLVFSRWSSLLRTKSSKRSFNAVHSRTAMKGNILECQDFVE
mmetsp:Transcript_26340/g.69246  ORF Transcript_26340/g.69246 Transcript_26340/m.69246 type:complete len:228 (-) Transcript_26340:365-1048(-)